MGCGLDVEDLYVRLSREDTRRFVEIEGAVEHRDFSGIILGACVNVEQRVS